MKYLNLVFNSIRKKNFFRAFTLVEAMMGIFIISVSVGGPMVVAGRAAQEIRYSRDIFITTFLAEEAIELIRFHRDSIFLECSDQNSAMCLAASSTVVGYPTVQELPNETAWKVFKNQFGYSGGTLCFSATGCVFDGYSMLINPTQNSIPMGIYEASSDSCYSFFQDKRSQISGENTPSLSSLDFMYLCSEHAPNGSTDTRIRRVVKMTALSTSLCPSYDCMYNDDIKVDVTTFYEYRGSQRSVTVTDFIKPRS